MDDALSDIQRALHAIDPVMTAMTPDDLAKASPCDGWTVGMVATHLLNGLNERAAAAETEFSGSDDATALKDVPAAWRSTRAHVLAAFQQPGAMDREVRGPGGRMVPLRMMMIRILPIEVMLHGWDIARGSGLSTDLDPELAVQLLEAGRPLIEQFGRGTAFGPEQPAFADAPAADRLAAFYGRRLGD